MTCRARIFFVTALAFFIYSCGELPTQTAESGEGALSLRVWLDSGSGLAKSRGIARTTWDSVVVSVTGNDMDPVRIAAPLDPGSPFVDEEISGIPAGKNRIVEVFTVNTNGDRIHSDRHTIREVSPGEVIPVSMALRPIRGSIYLNLAHIPAEVDSVVCKFVCETDTFVTASSRRAMLNLSIDNVPDSSEGVLIIAGLDGAGEAVYVDTLHIVFSTTSGAVMHADFKKTATGLRLQLSLDRPHSTVISGSMVPEGGIEHESGELYFTEIMYYAGGDSDYVEIYNPSSDTVTFDTLLFEQHGFRGVDTKNLHNISIPPRERFVVGDSDAPEAWTDTSVALDLTTTGRWIVLRKTTGEVIDWVAYTNEDQDWPKPKRFHAIQFDPRDNGAFENNFGRNWRVAEEPIGDSSHFGSPKK